MARTEPTTEYPPRWRLARRVGGMFLVLVVLLAALWSLWAWWAAGAEARLLAEVPAAGAPILLADLQGPPIADDQNAALVLREAIKQLKLQPMAHDFIDGNLTPRLPVLPFSEAHRQLVRESLLDNAAVFALPDRLSDLPHARVEGFSVAQARCRLLANYLRAVALAAHMDGDDRFALQCVRHLLQIGRVAQEEALYGSFMASAVRAVAGACVEQIAADLRIGEGADAASPADIEATIDLLLADVWKHVARSCHAILIVDREDAAAAAGSSHWFIRPAYQLDVTRFWRRGHLYAKAVPHGYPATTAVAGEPFSWWTGFDLHVMTRRYSQGATGSMDRNVALAARASADCRAAAVLLAIQLYRLDHAGALPPDLNKLVPAYLPRVPEDPFAVPGTPMRYRVAPVPIVWSVGENVSDEGGSTKRLNGSSPGRRFALEDWVVPIEAQPPATAPAPLPTGGDFLPEIP